jgi:hypothetical protein
MEVKGTIAAACRFGVITMPTKPISANTHGLIDYVAAIGLMALPRLMNWGPRTTSLMTGAAIGHMSYSMMTRYGRGVVKVLPMRGHLALDAALAAGMMAAGMMLKDERVPVRSALGVLGAGEMIVTLLTDPETLEDRIAAAEQQVIELELVPV